MLLLIYYQIKDLLIKIFDLCDILVKRGMRTWNIKCLVLKIKIISKECRTHIFPSMTGLIQSILRMSLNNDKDLNTVPGLYLWIHKSDVVAICYKIIYTPFPQVFLTPPYLPSSATFTFPFPPKPMLPILLGDLFFSNSRWLFICFSFGSPY